MNPTTGAAERSIVAAFPPERTQTRFDPFMTVWTDILNTRFREAFTPSDLQAMLAPLAGFGVHGYRSGRTSENRLRKMNLRSSSFLPFMFYTAVLLGGGGWSGMAAEQSSAIPGREIMSWPGKIDLPVFPKTNPDRAFAELKIYGADGSPVRTPVEDWAGAARRVAASGEWRAWLAGRRTEVDGWIEKRQDHVEWIAGWAHDFVSPVDGSFLTFTPDEPGEETLSSPSDPKVKVTPKLHGAWVYAFRSRHAMMMIEAAQLFRLTGEARYAEWAGAQIDFYANNLDRWEVRGAARVMWQSLDEAVMLMRWVQTARLLDPFVTAERKRAWSDKLFRPEAALLGKAFQFVHNIACWHRSAVGCVALYTQDAALWQAAVDGPNGIRSQIARGITSDYMWYEQSLLYNDYVASALMPFFEYALMEGRGAELRSEMESLENLLLAPVYLRFPGGQLPNPADGGRPRRAPTRGLLDGTASLPPRGTNEGNPAFLAGVVRLFPTRIGLRLCEILGEKNWPILIDPPSVVPAAELPLVTSRNLESSRMAVIRSGPWQVYFHYGQLSGSHAQAEALNFEAFYGEIDLTHDSGTPGYGSALTTEYFRAGLGHNVPLVDGQGPKEGWAEDCWSPGQLDGFSATKVAASQPRYRPDAKASRSLAIEGQRLCDEVSIAMTDGKEHALGFVLNLQGKVKLPAEFSSERVFPRTDRPVGFKHWHDMRSMRFNGRAAFEVAFGAKIMRIDFELPGEFVVWHASVPDYPPGRREALYVETLGQSATLKTFFSPSEPGQLTR